MPRTDKSTLAKYDRSWKGEERAAVPNLLGTNLSRKPGRSIQKLDCRQVIAFVIGRGAIKNLKMLLNNSTRTLPNGAGQI